MKKLYYIVIAVGMFGLATFSQAATFETGDQYHLAPDATVNDDLYVAGGNVSIGGTVNGDLFVAAGNVKIDGTVKGALFAAGGQIDVTGKVDGTARVAGGNVTVNGIIGKDLLVSAGNVDIASRAKISGQLLVGGGKVNIAGETGKVMGGISDLSVHSSAKINGDLVYTSDSSAVIDSAAKITGKVEKHLVEKNKQDISGKISRTAFGVGALISLIGTILIAWLFSYLLPIHAASVADLWGRKFMRNLLRGFILLVVTPFVVIFLLVTVIGVPLAFIIAIFYVLVLILAKFVSVIVVGAWAYSYLRKDRTVIINLTAIALGSLIMLVLGYIPLLGGLANALIFIAAIGALTDFVFSKLRQKKY